MEANYRSNIAKWLPSVSPSFAKWYNDSSSLYKFTRELTNLINSTSEELRNSSNGIGCRENLKRVCDNLEELSSLYGSVVNCSSQRHPVHEYKRRYFLTLLKRRLNLIAKISRDLIREVLDRDINDSTEVMFSLVNARDKLLDHDLNVAEASVNIFHNNCPRMIEPLKKLSITRLLQILAKNKAEAYCHELIECLLANYHPEEATTEANRTGIAFEEPDLSENSSIEIYRTLTKHVTPPVSTVRLDGGITANTESMRMLVNGQNDLVNELLRVAKDASPRLFGPDALKTSQGKTKLRTGVSKRVTDYYQEVAWGAVSGILDHVVLWWSPEALAARHSQGALHLKDWLHQFVQGSEVPPTVLPALQNLCDALGSHVTTTAWDQLFRAAYTSSFDRQSKPRTLEETETGRMFAELFALLVSLSNECEVGGEWVVGAPLLELPLSEQITVLHRVDHSVHVMRLWVMREASYIAHTWNLGAFFLLVRGDLKTCIEELSYLKLADHTNALASETVNVQVYVCARMRAKITSEVYANVRLLEMSPAKCIDTLAKICRTVSLANLHMCFPKPSYWRRNEEGSSVEASPYVAVYLDRVLLPVLRVVDDHEISNMILKILGESWLDYIYLHRVKFSERGAFQLLTDFAFVARWLNECRVVSSEVRGQLLKNEVLRRCEGVGRLLLRQPGEAITMHQRQPGNEDGNGSPESLGLERMPAEMYVPNQEQWLELRAPRKCHFFCTDWSDD